jgi:NADPH:quinone reductase-like Zn-dependent oxidoreductase
MKLRYKIPLGILAVFAILLLSLMLTVSYTADCPSDNPATAMSSTMKAARYFCYGSPEVVEYGDVSKPVPAADELLVKVHAASVNPLDWHFMRGSPFIMRLVAGIGAPDDGAMGVDFAGTVEAVGSAVTRFQPGDEVFGGANGAFAEYLVVREDRAVTAKPDNVSFEEAAGVPIAGVTALQALRDHGELKPGERVLINGASGGVGTFAVQLAKSMGAHVTGVCSGRNVDMVKSIGADAVINYKEEDYTRLGQQYDLIVDMVGNHSPLANQRLLSPGGRLIIVGGAKGDWIAPFMGLLKASLTSLFVEQKLAAFTARMLGEDLATLAAYMDQGEVTTVIDRRYPLEQTREAIAHSESGRARGKIILTAF